MNKLREIRQEKGLTLLEVAERAGTTATQISRLENGRRKLDLQWISRLSSALEVTEDQIVGDAVRKIALAPRVKDIGPQPPIISFLTICHERVLSFRSVSPVVLGDFLDHRRCFGIAIMLTASFFPLYEKVGMTDELAGTLSYYIAHIAVTDALKAGNSAVEDAAIAMRDGSFAFSDPEHDTLGKMIAELDQKD